MAREVVVHLWCDPCLAEDQHVEGQELPPLHLPELTGNRPRVAAVCERHYKELYQPLLDLLEEHGQPVDEEGNPTAVRGKGRPRKSDQPMSCPSCGHTSPNRGALASHVKLMHSTTLAELLGEGTLTCPECGQQCARPQGLSAHRRSVHGIEGGGRKAPPDDDGQAALIESEPKKAPAKRASTRARKKA